MNRLLPLLVLAMACGSSAAPPPASTPDAGVMPPVFMRGDAAFRAPDAGVALPERPIACVVTGLEVGEAEASVSVAVSSGGQGLRYGWPSTGRLDFRSMGQANGMSMQDRVDGVATPSTQLATAGDLALWTELGGRVRATELTTRDVFELGRADALASPDLAAADGGYWAAWLERRGASGWGMRARFLGDTRRPRLELPWRADEPHLAIAAQGERVYFAWLERGDVYLGVVENGRPVGEPLRLSTESNAAGALDLSFHERGGLVAFGVRVSGQRPEIRSRLLRLDGSAVSPEQIVSASPLRGREPSVATFGGGFAVVYRAEHVRGAEEMMLAFVHGSSGRVVEAYPLGAASFGGGRPGVAVTADGIIGTGWSRASAEGMMIRGAQMDCQEAWLRCSLPPTP